MIPEPQIIRCSAKSEPDRNKIFVKMMSSIVFLTHAQVHDGLILSSGGFSGGFLGGEGHITTCCHCAGKARFFKDDSGNVRDYFLISQKYVEFIDRAIAPAKAKLVVTVPEFDLAILKIPSIPQSCKSNVVTFSKSPPKIGDSCFVTGHSAVEFSTRCGVVFSPARYPYHFSTGDLIFRELFKNVVDGLHLLELDINCRPGFSGSPAFSQTGEVCGIVLGKFMSNSTLASPSVFCHSVLNLVLHKPPGGDYMMDGAKFVTEDMKANGDSVVRLIGKKK